MGDSKVETPMPKSVATAGEVKIGSLRLQMDGKADEVHVHDGDLRFAFKGIRKFQLAFADFKSSLAMLDDKDIVVFPGDPAGGKGACDLVMKISRGNWTVGLDKCGTIAGTKFGDEVIYRMDEWVQRA